MTDQIRDRWKPVPISQLKDFQPAEFTWTAPDGREVTLEVYRRGGAKRPSLFLHVEQFYYGPETDIAKELKDRQNIAYRGLTERDKSNIRKMRASGKPRLVLAVMFGLTTKHIEKIEKEEAIEVANKDNDFTDDYDRTFLDETAMLLRTSPTGE